MDLNFDEKTRVLSAKPEGVLTHDVLRTFFEEVLRLHHEGGALKLFIDWTDYEGTDKQSISGEGFMISAQMGSIVTRIAIICGPEYETEASSWSEVFPAPMQTFPLDQRIEARKWLIDV